MTRAAAAAPTAPVAEASHSLDGVAGRLRGVLMRGRDYVLPQDVLDIAPDVLRHRLVLSYDALADDIPADHIVDRVLATVPAPTVAPRQSAVPPGPAPLRGGPPGVPASAAAVASVPAAPRSLNSTVTTVSFTSDSCTQLHV